MFVLSVTSSVSYGPEVESFSLGFLLCPTAMTFSPPCFFRSSMTSSEPICPVAPVTMIFLVCCVGMVGTFGVGNESFWFWDIRVFG